MMSQVKFDENSYRQNKQKTLENLLSDSLKNSYKNINWIWLKEGGRRKVTLQIDMKNRLGFFAERSHNLIEIDEDFTAEKSITEAIPTLKNFLKKQEQNLYNQVTLTAFDNGIDAIFRAKRKLNFTQEQNLMEFAKTADFNISTLVDKDFTPIFAAKQNQIFYPDFKISLTSDIFIQATKEGLKNIVKIIRENIKNTSKAVKSKNDQWLNKTRVKPSKEGLKIVDFYAGFGAYSFAVQDLVGSVLAIEGDEKMTKLITKNASENRLAQKIKAQTRDLFDDPLLAKELSDFDVAIINPPRNGAETQIKQIAKSKITKVIYVSCNPQSFLRDVQILTNSGFKIKNLCALDQFYKTKHLELISTLEK